AKPAHGVRTAHVTSKRAAETRKRRATRPTAAATAKKPSKAADKGAQRRKPTAPKAPPGRTPTKKSAIPAPVEPSVWTQLNDARLGRVEGALSRTGSHEECVNGYGVFDMVGNLHEWVRTDPARDHGTFAGGYYLDTTINGDGCHYRTTAHARDYHDYST